MNVTPFCRDPKGEGTRNCERGMRNAEQPEKGWRGFGSMSSVGISARAAKKTCFHASVACAARHVWLVCHVSLLEGDNVILAPRCFEWVIEAAHAEKKASGKDAKQ